MSPQVFADLFSPANVRYILAGLRTTLLISIVTVLLSVFWGSVLALLRNYGKKTLGRFASIYIEIFRSTPLLLWILICIFMLPFGNALIRGTLGLTLYTSSVIAEIVRGGLNSVEKGQFEAARSQGFSFFQTLLYIVLPQCFMRIVPSLMSQIITTIKDTSFFAQFAIAEFFFNSKQLMGIISKDTVVTSAHIFVLYCFIALVYFVINFALSCIVRKLARNEQSLSLHPEQ
ncbi:amino acid ABC transporter permease [Leadbettera azotonutricia]|uniref:Polar amino acid ABC transporter, inner membrane subunit n=1 Tax=Leadbettera azotonutricia (strain ATCC BAA-888 / DSM 13862 / ZAS-9) TaxID=545695 RepID=F5YFX0_LEAAZ|nr:amino acid ABC transporter permease [Leadbettera azotonutricia]AEF83041.1 polar amino acid ABC transporter, inner membrane subunit [Leadbettera azotonutricia ZAS-9]